MISRERLEKSKSKGLKRAKMLLGSRGLYNTLRLHHPENDITDRSETYDELVERFAREHRKTTKKCSSYCCGNHRKYEGKTLQEKRDALKASDEY